MSKKIITNILNYLLEKEAQSLVISRQKPEISLDYYLATGRPGQLSLPKNLEKSFFSNLNEVLNIDTNKLINRKYHKIKYHNKTLPVYLTILPEKNQERIIIDLIKKSNKFWRLSQLGLKTPDLKFLKKFLTSRRGIIVINSPAGEGKSTTLYALAALLNNPKFNIYFLGDSSSKLINQIAPGINILKPANDNWLRLRRQDSDIILADDLNDAEDLKEALLTANTGRLVVITTTAKDSSAVIKKIKTLKLPPRLIENNLKIIISQKLSPLRTFNKELSYSDRLFIGQFYLLKL